MKEQRYILAGYFIDGLGGEIGKKVWLMVEDGIITAIGKMEELSLRPEVPIDDLSHCTLLPALVDCSIYLAKSPAVSTNSTEGEETVEENAIIQRTGQHLRYCQTYGVLGVCEGGLTPAIVDRLVRSPKNELVKMRLVPQHGLSPHGNGGECWPTGEFLKVSLSPSIDGKKHTLLNEKEVSRLASLAETHRVVALANGREDVATALAAGCSAIEQGYRMGEDNLRAMAARDILWIPSILRAKNAWDSCRSGGSVTCRFSQRYVAPGQADPVAEQHWQQVLAEQLAQLNLARQLGVRTAVGSGAGSMGILHGESVTEEVKLFLQAGYSLAEALACASTVGADFFGFTHLGPLIVGQPATFLVTRGAASQLPRKLGFLENIYTMGRANPNFSKYPQTRTETHGGS